jgi:hypothetical protein
MNPAASPKLRVSTLRGVFGLFELDGFPYISP